MKGDRQQHWDGVYGSRAADEVSWFQALPRTSVRLVGLASHGRPDASVIDVGAGTSRLVDALLETSPDVTVLDVSGEALDAAARRLGPRGDHVSWVQADLLQWLPDRTFDVWHDRAVLHFLITAQDIAAYVDLARRAVAPDGALVLGVFALDGPASCSGLPTSRYDAARSRLPSPTRSCSSTKSENYTAPRRAAPRPSPGSFCVAAETYIPSLNTQRRTSVPPKREEQTMCRPATCRQCGKATWAGCGQHVDSVMAAVPTAQRCSCESARDSSVGTRRGWRLFRR